MIISPPLSRTTTTKIKSSQAHLTQAFWIWHFRKVEILFKLLLSWPGIIFFNFYSSPRFCFHLQLCWQARRGLGGNLGTLLLPGRRFPENNARVAEWKCQQPPYCLWNALGLPQTICTGARLRGRTGTLFLLSQAAIWGGGGAFAQLDRVPFTANVVSDQPINDRGSLEKYNNETRGPWWTLNCRWNRFATLLHDWWHLVPLVLYTRQGKSKFRPPYVQTGRVSSLISVKRR